MIRQSSVIRILQITDPHLRAEPEGVLLGMNTRQSLDAVLQVVQQRHPQPDMVLATGDIAQDGSVAAYEAFQQRMQVFSCPVYWFAGNHDHRESMQQVIGGTPSALRAHREGAWLLIFLDSSSPGQVHGDLSAGELAHLDQQLAAHPDAHVLVCLHHHPVDVGCRWLAPIGLRNPDVFWSVLDQYTHVRGVLWGHIHQAFDAQRGGVRLLASPSTCVQFAPGSDEFGVDRAAPGYRWLELHPDGRIETGVERADHVDFEVDYSSRGY